MFLFRVTGARRFKFIPTSILTSQFLYSHTLSATREFYTIEPGLIILLFLDYQVTHTYEPLTSPHLAPQDPGRFQMPMAEEVRGLQAHTLTGIHASSTRTTSRTAPSKGMRIPLDAIIKAATGTFSCRFSDHYGRVWHGMLGPARGAKRVCLVALLRSHIQVPNLDVHLSIAAGLLF